MEAVKNGLHVHLGVSQNEKRPNALFLAGLEKEKTIFASRFCSLNCVAWLYINFSKLAFWFALYAFQIAKIPEGALMSVSNLQFKTPPRAAAKAVNVLLILGSYGGYFFYLHIKPYPPTTKNAPKGSESVWWVFANMGRSPILHRRRFIYRIYRLG